jgi:hypothetical protein
MSYGIASGQTFDVDDLLYLDSNGLLTVAAAAGAAVGDVKLVGVSKGNAVRLLAAYGSGAECPVSVIVPGSSQILMPVGHTTAASAVIAASETDAPLTVPIARGATGIWYADKEHNGTNDRLIWVERDLAYPFSETFATHWWKFVHATSFVEAT